ILEIVVSRAMERVRPRLHAEVRNAAAGLSVLGRIVRLLHLELADGVRGGTELDQAAAVQVKPGDGHAIDENLRTEELPAIDRSRERVADCAGKAGENEGLKLPPPVVYEDWKRGKLRRADASSDFGRRCGKQRRFGGHPHGLTGATDLEGDVNR